MTGSKGTMFCLKSGSVSHWPETLFSKLMILLWTSFDSKKKKELTNGVRMPDFRTSRGAS